MLHIYYGTKFNTTLKILVYKHNGTAHFKKCKQLFDYQHLLFLRETSGGQSSHLYINVVYSFNTSVNKASVAA